MKVQEILSGRKFMVSVAFLYFQLLRSYGDVVIWTDFSEGSSLDLGNLARPASSAADVMKLIVDDLQASETAFGDNYGFRNDSQALFLV
mgnify:CR=1 FL=1